MHWKISMVMRMSLEKKVKRILADVDYVRIASQWPVRYKREFNRVLANFILQRQEKRVLIKHRLFVDFATKDIRDYLFKQGYSLELVNRQACTFELAKLYRGEYVSEAELELTDCFLDSCGLGPAAKDGVG